MYNSSNQINQTNWKNLSFYNILSKIILLIPILIFIIFIPISFFEAEGINNDFYIFIVVEAIVCGIITIYANFFRKILENERSNHYGKSYIKIKPDKIIKIIARVLVNNNIEYEEKKDVNIKKAFINYEAIFYLLKKNIKIKIEKGNEGTFVSIGKITEINKTLIENLKKKIDETLTLELGN